MTAPQATLLGDPAGSGGAPADVEAARELQIGEPVLDADAALEVRGIEQYARRGRQAGKLEWFKDSLRLAANPASRVACASALARIGDLGSLAALWDQVACDSRPVMARRLEAMARALEDRLVGAGVLGPAARRERPPEPRLPELDGLRAPRGDRWIATPARSGGTVPLRPPRL